jgi:UDP-sugar transporter A1/2/3
MLALHHIYTKRLKKSSRETIFKLCCLAFLIFQMVALVLLMRSSLTNTSASDEPPVKRYLPSTAVLNMEVLKLLICLFVILQSKKFSIPLFLQTLHQITIQSPYELLKLSVPSILYTIQNNLLYLALSHLDSPTYQLVYQAKILTTAIFSVLMLNRKLSKRKWACLAVLTIGVILAQRNQPYESSSSQAMPPPSSESAPIVGSRPVVDDLNPLGQTQNRALGIVAVLLASITSGFSGVYFEKILKSSPATTLWSRNVQMGVPSVIIALVTCLIVDGSKIFPSMSSSTTATTEPSGFLQNYNTLTWTVILLQSLGGLCVALVVKHLDNIVKVFASSVAIVISTLLSCFFYGFRMSLGFGLAGMLVVGSAAVYSLPDTEEGGGGGAGIKKHLASSSNKNGRGLGDNNNKEGTPSRRRGSGSQQWNKDEEGEKAV